MTTIQDFWTRTHAKLKDNAKKIKEWTVFIISLLNQYTF